MTISGKCTGAFRACGAKPLESAQFEKGTNPLENESETERRGSWRENEEGGGAKINEEERARWGGFEKEEKRPRVISVHRGLACTARCHVTGALHFSVTSR